MKRLIPVLLVLAAAGGLPGSAAAAPRYPCGEMHRTVDVTRTPLCALPRPWHPGADLVRVTRPELAPGR